MPPFQPTSPRIPNVNAPGTLAGEIRARLSEISDEVAEVRRDAHVVLSEAAASRQGARNRINEISEEVGELLEATGEFVAQLGSEREANAREHANQRASEVQERRAGVAEFLATVGFNH